MADRKVSVSDLISNSKKKIAFLIDDSGVSRIVWQGFEDNDEFSSFLHMILNSYGKSILSNMDKFNEKIEINEEMKVFDV